jgi:tRNA U34 5-carboxymethylaminomethyl modifying GTPase MnmE/TrmE
MGKKAKEHRKKVAKRNANIKQNEKKMEKEWMDAMQEQLAKMKEQFEKMSGDTENVEDVVSEGTDNDTTETSNYDTILEDGTKVQIAGFHNVGEND